MALTGLGIICAALLAAGILCREGILESMMLSEEQEDEETGRASEDRIAGGKGPGGNRSADDRGASEDRAADGKGPGGNRDADGKGPGGSGNADGKEPGGSGDTDRKESAGVGDDPGEKENPGNSDKMRGQSPQSDYFRQMAEIIWEKDWEDIAPEEYAGLTSLQIDRKEDAVSCQLRHGYVMTFFCQGDLEVDFADLGLFTGLEWLSVDSCLQGGELRELDGLSAIYARNTAREIAAMISCPQQVTEIGVVDWASEKRLDGLEAFPNLRYLSVRYGALEDISALEQFPNLRGLALEGCEALRDYGPLSSLEELEWLKVVDCGLEELDFLKGMPKLASLSLEDMYLPGGAEGIFGIPTLRYLYLDGCGLELDFDRVPANEALEVLSLNRAVLFQKTPEGDGERVGLGEHPDFFERFPNLRELYLASLGLDTIAFVEVLTNLQYLDIRDNPVTDLGPLEKLPDLRGAWHGSSRF